MSGFAGLLPIGHQLWTLALRVSGQKVDSSDHVLYDYTIIPVRCGIREIRIGRAMPESDFSAHYGPMAKHLTDVSYLACPEGEKFILDGHVFSPNGDHLIGHDMSAGIQQRAYLSKSQLRPYAEEIRASALKTLPAVGKIEISRNIP